MGKLRSNMKEIVHSAGLVFGDIGTSPIYTLTIIFLLITIPTANEVIGVLSLIFWTMTLLVTIQYAWLATSLSKKGEGGNIIQRDILVPLLKSSKQIVFVTILAFIGISLLIGDGVITPAISILSAVEGLRLIPGLENTGQGIVIFIAALIALGLFSFQRKGTDRVAGTFGPLMVIWFSVLAISGIVSIISFPAVFKAINPVYGINFLFQEGFVSFLVLSNVILCATGGEALYADMGHLGRGPIVKAWSIVFVALILNYFGQGAFLLNHPEAKNLLFEMIFNQARILYIPFLILSIMATVIASQAMISGMFSLVYQGITTRIMPMFKVEYTSSELRSKIYIGAVNWFLLAFVILIMLIFKESHQLATAYGLAVTGSMTVTGTMMIWTFYLRKNYTRGTIELFVTMVVLVYLFSNTLKIPTGAYWSIIIASIPLSMIILYTTGQKKLYQSLKLMPFEEFIQKYNQIYENSNKISGSALFFARNMAKVPPYIVNTMFVNNIIYENNIIVSINIIDCPYGINASFKEDFAKGLKSFEIEIGYMEIADVEAILKQAGINEKVIFYGLEEIVTDSLIWKGFAIIKKLTPSFVQFYKLPSQKIHGIITRIEM
ncbi:MAG TPA: potassium transporter Kup [Cyanobacteria bacterium UBA9579]|nr:potassium transporter Kup [Cyanobacteria bacterium UBA9579]